jgi:hypothetical protein
VFVPIANSTVLRAGAASTVSESSSSIYLTDTNCSEGGPDNSRHNEIDLNNILHLDDAVRQRNPTGSSPVAARAIPEWAQEINAPIPDEPRGNREPRRPREPRTPQAAGSSQSGPGNSGGSGGSSGHRRGDSGSGAGQSFVPGHSRNPSGASAGSQSGSRHTSPMHVDSQGGSRQTSPTPARGRASSSLAAILETSPEKRLRSSDKGKGKASEHPSKMGDGSSSGRRRGGGAGGSGTAA